MQCDSWSHRESAKTPRSRNTVWPFLKYPVRCSHWTVIRFLMYREPFLKYRADGPRLAVARQAVKRVLLDAKAQFYQGFGVSESISEDSLSASRKAPSQPSTVPLATPRVATPRYLRNGLWDPSWKACMEV